MQDWIARQLGVSRIADHHARLIAPFGSDRIAGARDGAASHVQAGPQVPNACWSEGAGAPGKVAHEAASARMSFSTPAAVTAGPAPGPVMMSGFVW